MFSIWYVDEEYLNSIYNQIAENVIQNVITQSYEVNKDIDRIGNVGNIGIPVGISLNYRHRIAEGVIQEKVLVPAMEEKIMQVKEYIKTKKKINDVIKARNIDKGIVWIEEMFQLQELYYQGERRNLMNEIDVIKSPKELTWHLNYRTYVDNSKREYEDSPERVKEAQVDMYMGGDKLRRNIKHITTKIEKRHAFLLDVIGELERYDNCSYTIKPIVICQDMPLC